MACLSVCTGDRWNRGMRAGRFLASEGDIASFVLSVAVVVVVVLVMMTVVLVLV